MRNERNTRCRFRPATPTCSSTRTSGCRAGEWETIGGRVLLLLRTLTNCGLRINCGLPTRSHCGLADNRRGPSELRTKLNTLALEVAASSK